MSSNRTMSPTQIEVAFNHRFCDALLDGTKTYTTRYRCLGQTGDNFMAFGAVFVIDKISKVYLYHVANYLYKKEGFDSTQEFIDFWNYLHPRRRYQPNAEVYLHRFFRET